MFPFGGESRRVALVAPEAYTMLQKERSFMKILIAAAALIVALPAAANAQAAQPAHAEHKHGSGHGEEHKDCCKHKNADGTPMDCCKPAKDGKRAACCDKHDAKAEHGGHDMSKH
jgi:hypothetical protein